MYFNYRCRNYLQLPECGVARASGSMLRNMQVDTSKPFISNQLWIWTSSEAPALGFVDRFLLENQRDAV
jgi:hypothetical protein